MHSWSSPAHPYSYVSQKPRAIQSRIPTRNIASKAIFASFVLITLVIPAPFATRILPALFNAI